MASVFSIMLELLMIHYEKIQDIDATSEAIWSVLGRFMHIDEFAPLIKSVDALTDGEDGIGSKRRNNFDDGTSVVEEGDRMGGQSQISRPLVGNVIDASP